LLCFFSNLRERDLADETIATYMRALRTVLYFLMDRGYLRKFTDDELKKFLRKPDIKKCSFVEYRDWVIINYILGMPCGKDMYYDRYRKFFYILSKT